MPEKRVGIFGGVFDPVHNGHLAVVRTALSTFSLTFIYIVPCGIPAHKRRPLFSPDQRLSLLQAAFAGNPRVIVSDIELRREGVSYSIDTVEAIRKKEGVRPYFFIGGDNLSEISGWRTPDKILEQAQVVAVSRPGFDSLEKFPEYQGRIISMTMEPMAVSSSEIRRRLEHGEDASWFIPPSALEIIKQFIA
jgi:nicotinate-nucleotide adenylyltransferase